MVAAGVLLLIPIVALMWVPLYARETPKLFDFPFFIWYQFAWVFLCSAMTWTAFKLTLSARAPRRTTDVTPVSAPTLDAAGRLDGINGVAFTVLVALFLLVTVLGFMASRFRRADDLNTARRVGAGRAQVRHLGHLVPARRRPLHRLHVRGGAGRDVRHRRGHRLLRRALHDRALPDHLRLHGAAVVGEPPARLRHARRLRPRPVRRPRAVPRRGGDRIHRDDALHRPAARRHPGGAGGRRHRRRRQLGRQGPAAVRGVRAARRLHLLLGPAGAGADRVRQGHPDLPGDHRRDRLPARRRSAAGTTSSAPPRRRWRPPTRPPGHRPARSSRARSRCGPTPPSGLGSALALFMYPHSITATLSSGSRNTIRRNAAILPAYSFVLGLLALLGWVAIAAGTQPDRRRRQAERAAGDPAAVRGHVPELVRRRRLRGDRHRCPGAGGDHVDRGGQHVHPQHLQGVAQQGRDPGAGGQGLQAGVAGGEGVRAGLRADPRQAERDQLPAARRDLDPADLPVDRVQPLHAMVPPQGAAGGLGGRHGLRHGARPTRWPARPPSTSAAHCARSR